MTSPRLPAVVERRRNAIRAIKESSYDRTSAWLSTWLLFVGIIVAGLFLLRATTGGSARNEWSFVLVSEPQSNARGGSIGYSDELEPPGAAESSELSEPQIERTLEQVVAVSTVAASFRPVEGPHDRTDQSDARGPRSSKEGPSGPDGEPSGVTPRWERWEIHFALDNMDEYARQLDYFGIELGAAGGGTANLVDYARSFSSSPQVRSASPSDETRLYMTWTSGSLRDFDLRLLERCGVTTRGRVVMQFYTRETEERLAAAERAEMQRNGIDDLRLVRTTVFGVFKTDVGYEFRALEQRLAKER